VGLPFLCGEERDSRKITVHLFIYLNKLAHVLTRVQEAGLKINAVKRFFAQTNLEYLSYNMSRDGLHPSHKKVEAILQIKAPTTRKQLRQFIGMVYYFCDIWPQRSHVLSPLSSMTSAKVIWKWIPECQEAFDQMKAIMAKETLVTFPDFTKELEIHTDASKLQLGTWSLHLTRWQACSILLMQTTASPNLLHYHRT
jgi:hypothetical protein